MVEVSTSILSADKENSLGVFYNLEVAKTDYFHKNFQRILTKGKYSLKMSTFDNVVAPFFIMRGHHD